ncbi:dsRBD fold-containing protein [Streptomyces sp. NPDC054933]
MTRHETEWNTHLYVVEEGNVTRAKATLDTTTAQFSGDGEARKNPRDPQVHEIGDELAAGRALADLSRKLLREAVQEIDENEGMEPREAEPSPARLWQ